MRLVLDTNVLISALLFGGNPEKVVFRVLGGAHTLVLSPYIIEETNRILEAKFDVAPATISLLNQLLSTADIQYFQPFLHVLADEPDNRVLETAVRGRADAIVTGDKQLLEHAKHDDILIITPTMLLEAFRLTLQ